MLLCVLWYCAVFCVVCEWEGVSRWATTRLVGGGQVVVCALVLRSGMCGVAR
jgi:hypothetical protein